jgi:hypothetical protein
MIHAVSLARATNSFVKDWSSCQLHERFHPTDVFVIIANHAGRQLNTALTPYKESKEPRLTSPWSWSRAPMTARPSAAASTLGAMSLISEKRRAASANAGPAVPAERCSLFARTDHQRNGGGVPASTDYAAAASSTVMSERKFASKWSCVNWNYQITRSKTT